MKKNKRIWHLLFELYLWLSHKWFNPELNKFHLDNYQGWPANGDSNLFTAHFSCEMYSEFILYVGHRDYSLELVLHNSTSDGNYIYFRSEAYARLTKRLSAMWKKLRFQLLLWKIKVQIKLSRGS